MIHLKFSSLLVAFSFGLSGCGGQTAGADSSSTVNSNTGGTATWNRPSAGGSGTPGNNLPAGGGPGTAIGGTTYEVTGANTGTGGAASPICDSSSSDWSICLTDPGSLTAVGGTTSIGGNSCAAPASPAYVRSSNYAGYAFSFVTLSQTDGDILNCSVGGPSALCTNGQLDSMNYSYIPVSAIGVNLNQNVAPDSSANPVPQTINSVTVTFTASSNYGRWDWLRVQVNQGTVYYCYAFTNNLEPAYTETAVTYAGTITLGANQFTTECWNRAGDVWDGSGATGIQLTVANIYGGPLEYEMCLSSLTID